MKMMLLLLLPGIVEVVNALAAAVFGAGNHKAIAIERIATNRRRGG